MRTLILDTGLFPDRETVSAAVAELEADGGIERIEIGALGADDTAWDAVVGSILQAEKLITL